MNKLGFLAGDRSGETSVLRGPGQFEELTQTESVQFKLDGLVPAIEGIGRTKADGKLSLQALGLISFDDETGTYRMRAFNDGRWLETEVKLADGGNSITWGFALGEFKTTTVLRIDENGEMDRIRGASNRRPPPAENDGVKGSPQFPLNDSSRSVARCSYWHGLRDHRCTVRGLAGGSRDGEYQERLHCSTRRRGLEPLERFCTVCESNFRSATIVGKWVSL